MTTPHPIVRRLLVVDDERIQRTIVARAVETEGYAVDAAESLAAAFERLAESRYDVVVLDLSLGETEGISLLQTLRDSGCDPVVIFISRLDDRVRTACTRLASGLGLRVGGALAKPVLPGALRALLREAPAHAARIDRGPDLAPTDAAFAEALRTDLIDAWFQPQISLRTGAVVGMEALARWPLSRSTGVPPDVFIPLAERLGSIGQVTERILRRALSACRRWRETHPACSVAVNFSPSVLTDPMLPDTIEAILREFGLGPGALIAEITESTVIANPLVAAEVLTRLRIRGIGLSIDDFGTGHSSLLTLLRLPFSELKIDRSFTSQCDTDPEAWKIVRATISMARELGLRVVAEGIETQTVERMLRDAGCDIGQGWLYGKAMPEDALRQWLNENEKHEVQA